MTRQFIPLRLASEPRNDATFWRYLGGPSLSLARAYSLS